MAFKDHFSGHADVYARSRPDYPEALFADLAALAHTTGLAWDSGTGNGQAARHLARHFDRVIASDASAEQIQAASPLEGVRYELFPAEQPHLEPASVDLVTVAQALHWFNIPAFFTAVDRVLKAGGLLAVWCYQNCRINPEIDQVVGRLYSEILDTYWPEERRLVEEGYVSIAFPYERLAMRAYQLELRWEREQLLDYLESWSASQRYQQDQGVSPLGLIEADLARAWP